MWVKMIAIYSKPYICYGVNIVVAMINSDATSGDKVL